MGNAIARGSHRSTRRTILSASPESQLLLKLVAAIGAETVQAAEALVLVGFSFESAVHMLATWECEDPETCGFVVPIKTAVGIDAVDPRCPRCWQKLRQGEINPFTLRQRIHRMLRRVRDVLGPAFLIEKRRRAVVGYGADDSGVFRTAAAAEIGGDE